MRHLRLTRQDGRGAGPLLASVVVVPALNSLPFDRRLGNAIS